MYTKNVMVMIMKFIGAVRLGPTPTTSQTCSYTIKSQLNNNNNSQCLMKVYSIDYKGKCTTINAIISINCYCYNYT